MATVTQTALLNIQANTAQATAALNALQATLAKVTAAAHNASRSSASSFGSAGNALTGLQAVLAGFAGGAGFAAVAAGINTFANAVGLLTKASLHSAATMEALRFGLNAVNVSSKTTTQLMRELVEVAKLPGLDLEGAVRGSVRLQAAGLSAEMATRALMAFGNALATVGAGPVELNGVMIALTQIASKTRVSAEEINQMGERLPQIRKAMMAAFGTADTEKLANMGIEPKMFIEKIIAEFEKLEKVTGGLKVLFENVQSAWTQVTAAFGAPIGQALKEVVDDYLKDLPKYIDTAADSGMVLVEVFHALGDELRYMSQQFGPAIEGLVAVGKIAIKPTQMVGHGIGYVAGQAYSLAIGEGIRTDADFWGEDQQVGEGMSGLSTAKERKRLRDRRGRMTERIEAIDQPGKQKAAEAEKAFQAMAAAANKASAFLLDLADDFKKSSGSKWKNELSKLGVEEQKKAIKDKSTAIEEKYGEWGFDAQGMAEKIAEAIKSGAAAFQNPEWQARAKQDVKDVLGLGEMYDNIKAPKGPSIIGDSLRAIGGGGNAAFSGSGASIQQKISDSSAATAAGVQTLVQQFGKLSPAGTISVNQ